MSTPEEKLAQLRKLASSIRAVDPELAEESGDRHSESALEAIDSGGGADEAIALESIIMRRERPVLAVKKNEAELVFADAIDSEIWTARLKAAKPHLDHAIHAVGRVDLRGAPLSWVGTGWLVHDTIMVTNRHVANEFARRNGEGFSFRAGSNGPISAAIDFLQEIGSDETLLFNLVRPLHIENAAGHDVAFFEVEPVSGANKLGGRIKLSTRPAATESVAVLGYPAYDSRIPEPELMERIYGKIYNKKRLAPGGVTGLDETKLFHNCTTLGGNSGSVVLDLNSGEALGLHFSGSFLTTNYAVRADVVAKLLDEVRSGRTSVSVPREAPVPPPPPPPVRPSDRDDGSTIATVTIPLTVTVSVGRPDTSPAAPARALPGGLFTARPSEDHPGSEGRAEDYRERKGYKPEFLGVPVAMPEVRRDSGDVLEFEYMGKVEKELRYEHYSVVMSRGRRMCFLSAVNINGGTSRKSKRVGWKWDPRIPRERQIMGECYGDPPRFSRGHMTRREDPAWGDDDATARRGNEDSMHVTNVTPQMQAFNSPIWLALEDYALEHAREDGMKISVFTGPYFEESDPVMYGVRIPLTFWKVIAFIHEETGKLCATGYEMDQRKTILPEEEFVFGQFVSPQLGIATQVPLRRIADRSGIWFGDLPDHDPMATATESRGAAGEPAPLMQLEQVRFTA
jgi:endonuclease G